MVHAGWVDGHPALGWEATAAYLSLPIILVITQTISQKILQPPPSDDPAQQQTQQILKFLPLMIGWFALNVPAGLGVYWVFNNAITTSQVNSFFAVATGFFFNLHWVVTKFTGC